MTPLLFLHFQKCGLSHLGCVPLSWSSAPLELAPTPDRRHPSCHEYSYITRAFSAVVTITPWSTSHKRNSIDYDKIFMCDFPACASLPDMKTGEMVTHLHTIHHYNLVQCDCIHCTQDCPPDCDRKHHTSNCYKLGDQFLTITDAQLEHTYLRKPLLLVNLVEHRRPLIQETQKKKILMEASEMFPPGQPSISKPPSSPSPSVPTTSHTPQPLSVDQRFTACIVAYTTTHPEFSERKIHELLVAESMSVEVIMASSAADLKECGLRVGEIVTLRKFVAEWVEANPV